MKLEDYIKYRGVSQKEAADQIGIKRQWLNAIIKGKSKPGMKAVKGIIRWSNGDVRLEDLI